MLELINYNQETLNTKDRIIIDFLKEGHKFLEKFDINHKMIIDAVSIVNRFLRIKTKFPQNIYKFFVAAFYIVERHPWSFPAHESKTKFCKKFGIDQSSLDYSIERIVTILKLVKIIDDKNFPYFIDRDADISYKLSKSIVKNEVEKAMMNFLLLNQPINSQILSENIITKLIFEMKLFPEELFRQFFEIIIDLVEKSLIDYYEYAQLQEKYFI
jgi:hypothetical protein